MNYDIIDIEGIGESYAKKLKDLGINNTTALLERCGAPKGRKEVSEACGISSKHLLTFTNHADLMRIKGIGGQYSEILEEAGVDTVKELRTRNAKNLSEKIAETNSLKKLNKGLVSESMVQGWIDQAKEMDPKVSH